MSKSISWTLFISIAAALLAISICEPKHLSDQNPFLKGFVNHEFLSFMGILVTITLTTAATIHIALTNKEERQSREIFPKTKASVRKSATSLLWALASSVVIVVVKPNVNNGEVSAAIMNSLCLLVILWSLLILADISKLAFKV